MAGPNTPNLGGQVAGLLLIHPQPIRAAACREWCGAQGRHSRACRKVRLHRHAMASLA